MRWIDYIVVHCSATRENQSYNALQLSEDHYKRGIGGPMGYHFYIPRNGIVITGRKLSRIGAHVKGYNTNSVGICYEGGLDKHGKAKDNRTIQQKIEIKNTIYNILKRLEPYQPVDHIQILGHRDFSPDINKDGKISKYERMKECPCYDVIEEDGWITHTAERYVTFEE